MTRRTAVFSSLKYTALAAAFAGIPMTSASLPVPQRARRVKEILALEEHPLGARMLRHLCEFQRRGKLDDLEAYCIGMGIHLDMLRAETPEDS